MIHIFITQDESGALFCLINPVARGKYIPSSKPPNRVCDILILSSIGNSTHNQGSVSALLCILNGTKINPLTQA